jgi:glycosyltransferase involved in cell wall biosynthesis
LIIDKSQYKVIAIIPAYNEESRIAEVVENTKIYVDEVIVVNDCSVDHTSIISKNAGAIVVDLPKNRGAGYATRIGCDLAIKNNANIIVTIDADGQHCAGDIPDLVNKLIIDKPDIVFGYRIKDKSMPVIKKIGNSFLSFLALVLFRIKIKDALTGFHAFTAESYPKIRWESERYGFILEYIYNVYKNNLKYAEVRVKTIYFDKKTGMSIKDGIKSIFLLLMWRIKVPKKVIVFFNLQ